MLKNYRNEETNEETNEEWSDYLPKSSRESIKLKFYVKKGSRIKDDQGWYFSYL